LLTKNPKLLREDPLLGIDYIKIINLIKRKKLVENSNNEFDPAQSIDTTFYDRSMVEEEKLQEKDRWADRVQRKEEYESL
jgi:hypothetical protein